MEICVALNGTSVTAEHLDISFNQGVGLIADQLDLDMSYTTIWTNTDTGLICSASDIDAANSVSVHNNDLSYALAHSLRHTPIHNTHLFSS